MAVETLQAGDFSAISLDESVVVKVTRATYSSYVEAIQFADNLNGYVAALGREPLLLATLQDTEVIKAQDGYRVRHTYDYVEGPNLRQASDSERRSALGEVVRQVTGMSIWYDPNSLAVPVDMKGPNVLIGPNGPVFVDYSPPLNRDAGGNFPTGVFPDDHELYVRSMGTKSGAITRLLATALNGGGSSAAKIAHLIIDNHDWCLEMLPADLDSTAREEIEREIRLHFASYILRGVEHTIRTKLHR